MEITTCQICARPIKAGKGVIAHHGYQRPNLGSGWQTASCAGARYLPYEVSCDRLPPTIATIKSFIERRSLELKDFVENPPETIIYTSRYDRNHEPKTLMRPDGFNPEEKHGSYTAYSYATQYHSKRYEIETSIKYAKSDLAFMEKRLADWVPPKK